MGAGRKKHGIFSALHRLIASVRLDGYMRLMRGQNRVGHPVAQCENDGCKNGDEQQ